MLIIRRELQEAAGPLEFGGGMIEQVSLQGFTLAESPEKRFYAGTPDVLGAFQIARVLSALRREGFSQLQAHEQQLTVQLIDGLQQLPGLTLYGSAEPAHRVGVASFNLTGLNHAQLAWILSWQFNISVRNGCFCAQPFVRHLLGLGQQLGSPDGTPPGMVRASLGAYTQPQDISALLDALTQIRQKPGYFAQLSMQPKLHQQRQQLAMQKLRELWE